MVIRADRLSRAARNLRSHAFGTLTDELTRSELAEIADLFEDSADMIADAEHLLEYGTGADDCDCNNTCGCTCGKCGCC